MTFCGRIVHRGSLSLETIPVRAERVSFSQCRPRSMVNGETRTAGISTARSTVTPLFPFFPALILIPFAQLPTTCIPPPARGGSNATFQFVSFVGLGSIFSSSLVPRFASFFDAVRGLRGAIEGRARMCEWRARRRGSRVDLYEEGFARICGRRASIYGASWPLGTENGYLRRAAQGSREGGETYLELEDV